MTEEELVGVLGWEGFEYALTEMRADEMPTEEGTAMLQKAQAHVRELYNYLTDLTDKIEAG